MRTFFAFILLAAATVPASAQQWATVAGRILDPSGAVVGDADVLLTARDAQSQRTVRTSFAGEFRFNSLPEGEYLLSARAAGFGSPEPLSLLLHAGAAETRDIQLELARVASQVQVTANATAQSAGEQAKALDVVDSMQFNARSKYSVIESIRTLPGIRVQQLGGPGSLARIRTRGLRPFDTSILIDGFRFRDAASPNGEASAFLGDLMLVDSDRVEMLRGSGSSLYGTNAAGGVLNIVTDTGGGRTHGDISFDGGGLGLLRAVARIGGGALDDRLRYSGGFSHLNVTSGVDGDDRYRNSAVQGAADYSLTPTVTLTGRVFAADTFAGLNENPYVPGGVVLPDTGAVPAVAYVNFIPSPNDPDSRRAARFASGLFAAGQRLSPTAGWRVHYQTVTTDRDNRDGPAGTQFPPQWNNSNYFGGRIDTLQARADLQLGGWNFITAGYEWEREAFDNHSTDENPDPALRVDARLKIDQQSHTAFIQDSIRMLDNRLQITLSGRTQAFRLNQPEFAGGSPLYEGVTLSSPPQAWTGDASIAYYFPTSGTKLRAHAGNGYRAPSLYERFGASFFYGSFSAYGDPRLAPERLISVDGGFDQYLASAKVKVSGTYFYTRLQEVIGFDFSGAITPDTDPFGRWGGYANTGGGLSRGFELSLEARPTSALTLQSAYTFTNADERRNLYFGAGLRSIDVSTHMFTATAIQRIGRRFDVSADLFAASSYLFPLFVGYSSRAFEFEGPVKADFSAGYNHPLSETTSLRLFTRVENFLNRTYYEDGFRTPKAWAIFGAKFSF